MFKTLRKIAFGAIVGALVSGCGLARFSELSREEILERILRSAVLMVNASVSYGANGGGVYEARHGDLIGVVEGYSTARVTAQGANPPWYIDVPVPGQAFVTPLSDVRRFLAEVGYVHLVAPTRGRSFLGVSADAR